MTNDNVQLWSRQGINLFFMNKRFELTDKKTESSNQSDGENRLVKQQQALINLLKGETTTLPEGQLKEAVRSRLTTLIDKNEQLKPLKAILLRKGIDQIPFPSAPQPTPENTPTAKTQPTAVPTRKPKAPSTPKSLRAASPVSLPAVRKPEQGTKHTSVNGFSILPSNILGEKSRIFYKDNEIYLDDDDEYTVLSTILEKAAKGEAVNSPALAFKLGQGARLQRIYMSLKQSMAEDAIESPHKLTYDNKTKKHGVSVPVREISSEDELKIGTIHVQPQEIPSAFGS